MGRSRGSEEGKTREGRVTERSGEEGSEKLPSFILMEDRDRETRVPRNPRKSTVYGIDYVNFKTGEKE